MKYIIFLVSVLVFAGTAFAQQVRVPEGVNCPPNNLRACLNNLSAAYNDLFEETVAYKEVDAINKVIKREINTCEANLDDANSILEEVVAERATLRAQVRNLRAQLSSSEMELVSAAGQDSGSLYATIEQLRNENNALRSQTQSSFSHTMTSSSSVSAEAIVTTRVEEATRDLAHLRLQLDALLLENDALKVQLAQQRPQVQVQTVMQTETVTAYPDDYYILRDQLAQLQGQVGQVHVQTETVTVYPDDYHTLRAENEQLRQALSHQAPMHTAPAPMMSAPTHHEK